MPLWAWFLVAVIGGVVVGLIVAPRVRRVVRETPPPDLPERFAPGWHARCTRCGRTRTLASAGGIRMFANRDAIKATLGWCRACRAIRVIRIIHASGLETGPLERPGSGADSRA